MKIAVGHKDNPILVLGMEDPSLEEVSSDLGVEPDELQYFTASGAANLAKALELASGSHQYVCVLFPPGPVSGQPLRGHGEGEREGKDAV